MILTEEQFNSINELARLFFTIDQIAVRTGIDTYDFRQEIESKKGPVYTAYITGWFDGEILLRKSIAASVVDGSGSAQQMMLTLMQNAQIDSV